MRERFALALAVLLATAFVARSAGATTVRGKPCPGCIASIPESADPAPLAVVLHGDGESPDGVFQGWAVRRRAAGSPCSPRRAP